MRIINLIPHTPWRRAQAALPAALCALVILAVPGTAAANIADLSGDTAGYVLNRFLELVQSHGTTLKEAATRLFIALTAITIVLRGIQLVFSHGDMQSFASVCVKFLLTTGFFFYILNNGPEIGASIVNSMLEIADDQNTGPAELFTLSSRLGSRFSELVEHIKAGFLGSLMLGLPCLYFFYLMCQVCASYCILFLSAYILCVTGVIVLGFGGLSYTRSIAVNYMRAIIACSLQLMVTVMICNAGFSLLNELFNELEHYSRAIVIEDCMVVIFVAMFVRGAVSFLPEVMGSMMYGGQFGDLQSRSRTTSPAGFAVGTLRTLLPMAGRVLSRRAVGGGRGSRPTGMI